jgi:hypothetical protein
MYFIKPPYQARLIPRENEIDSETRIINFLNVELISQST